MMQIQFENCAYWQLVSETLTFSDFDLLHQKLRVSLVL